MTGSRYGRPGWCQRWHRGLDTWRHVHDGGFDRRRYDWQVLDEATARSFVLAEHYAGSFPVAKLSVGLMRAERLVGVVVFGIPMHAAVLTNPFPTLTPFRQSVELSRLVLLTQEPANAETWLLARAFRHLRATTDVLGVLAFSDPVERVVDGRVVKPGHWGGVYQAKSAKYLGRSRPRTLTLFADGTVFSARARSKLLRAEPGWRYVRDLLVQHGATPPDTRGCPEPVWLRAALGDIGARQLRHGGNHRYAFPLAPRVPLGLPTYAYPKRDAA